MSKLTSVTSEKGSATAGLLEAQGSSSGQGLSSGSIGFHQVMQSQMGAQGQGSGSGKAGQDSSGQKAQAKPQSVASDAGSLLASANLAAAAAQSAVVVAARALLPKTGVPAEQVKSGSAGPQTEIGGVNGAAGSSNPATAGAGIAAHSAQGAGDSKVSKAAIAGEELSSEASTSGKSAAAKEAETGSEAEAVKAAKSTDHGYKAKSSISALDSDTATKPASQQVGPENASRAGSASTASRPTVAASSVSGAAPAAASTAVLNPTAPPSSAQANLATGAQTEVASVEGITGKRGGAVSNGGPNAGGDSPTLASEMLNSQVQNSQNAASAASAKPTVNSARIIDQVMSSAKMHTFDGGTGLSVRLDPPQLGTLYLNLASERGTVTAHIQATTMAAKQALDGDLASLKTSMADAGINVDSIHVSLAAGGGDGWSAGRQLDEGAGGSGRKVSTSDSASADQIAAVSTPASSASGLVNFLA